MSKSDVKETDDWIEKGQEWLDEYVEKLFSTTIKHPMMIMYRGNIYTISANGKISTASGNAKDFSDLIAKIKDIACPKK